VVFLDAMSASSGKVKLNDEGYLDWPSPWPDRPPLIQFGVRFLFSEGVITPMADPM
jgi:hypothetical protein